MIKRIVLFLCVFTAIGCKTPGAKEKDKILSFKNENFKAYLISLNYDKNKDGELSEKEAQAIESIALNSSTPLDSIAEDMLHLSNLKSFIGFGDTVNTAYPEQFNFILAKNIEVINLQGPSGQFRNIALAGSHPKLKEFVNMPTKSGSYSDFVQTDFSAMPALKTFGAGGMSVWMLNQLPLASLPHIKALYLSAIQMTHLAPFTVDLSGNADLEKLHISNLTMLPGVTAELKIFIHQDVQDRIDAKTFVLAEENVDPLMTIRFEVKNN